MTFLKTVLVTLFSFVLIGSQSVSAWSLLGSTTLAKAQVCTECDCAMMDCCLQQSSSSPGEPLQSIPVNTKIQSQQLLLAICTLLLQQPPATDLDVAAAVQLLPRAPAVPLFK